jgi:hypothetical protein
MNHQHLYHAMFQLQKKLNQTLALSLASLNFQSQNNINSNYILDYIKFTLKKKNSTNFGITDSRMRLALVTTWFSITVLHDKGVYQAIFTIVL